MKKIFFTLFCAFSAFITALANPKVEFLYDVDFAAYFDNREYGLLKYDDSQTLAGIRLQPELGVGITDSIHGSTHKLMAGVAYTQPFGAGWGMARFQPTVYYNFNKKGFSFYGGFVPYYYLIEQMPLLFQSEYQNYYTPNLQGALFQYQNKKGFVELFLDWRSIASASTREAFRVMFNGQGRAAWFYGGGWIQYNHLSGHSPWLETDCVGDDIVLNPYIGFNLSNVTPLDSFDIRASYMLSYQADRSTTSNYIHGVELDVYLRWRFLGFKNITFFGTDNMMPYYSKFGSLLNLGDPQYQSGFFNRTDIFFYIYNNSFVNCYASVNLVYDIPNGGIGWSQQLIAQFRLSGIKNKSTKLRNLLAK